MMLGCAGKQTGDGGPHDDYDDEEEDDDDVGDADDEDDGDGDEDLIRLMPDKMKRVYSTRERASIM